MHNNPAKHAALNRCLRSGCKPRQEQLSTTNGVPNLTSYILKGFDLHRVDSRIILENCSQLSTLSVHAAFSTENPGLGK